jgi:GNAT superfamily N-acetyltransferase
MTIWSAPTSTTAGSPRDSALAILRRTLEMVADDLRRIDPGWVVRSPSSSMVWALNHLRIDRPVTYEDTVALVEEHLAGLSFHRVVFEDEQTSEHLEATFLTSGWKVDRDVLMTLTRSPDRTVDTRAVTDASEAQALALMERWLAETMKLAPGELGQILDCTAREGAVWGERRLGVRGDDGAVAAMTKLRSDGTTAWVEDVYTRPDERGRGFARMLVTRATELARAEGHELVFIVADDDGWPKQLYARLGFTPVGRLRAFHRDAGQPLSSRSRRL